MDKIFNKIIKYGGTWSKNVFSLASGVKSDAAILSINWGSEKLNLIDGDILRLEIASSNFIVEYCQSTPNELKILESSSHGDISQLEEVSVLIHLQSKSPEDIPTAFELNRISKRLESSAEVHIVSAPSDKTEDRINVSSVRNDRKFIMELLESDGIEVFKSDILTLDENSYIHWHSLTPIPNGVFVIQFLPN